MKIEQRIYNGDRAREVLENEAFVEAFNAIETEVIEQWKSSPARDAAGRESMWTYLMLLSKLKAQLTQTLETGKLAQMELQHKRTLAERVKSAMF